MAAVRLLPWAPGDSPGGLVASGNLALATAAVALFLLLLSLAGAVVDAHLAGRAVAEATRLRQLSDSTFEGLLIHRDRTILDANVAFCGMTRLSLAQVRGQPLARFVTTWADALDSPIRTDGAQMREITVTMGDGGTFPAEVRSRDVDYGGRPARVTALRDIRERRAAEDRIRFLAHHDALTGLANRFQLNESAARAVAASLRSGEPIAVMCMDLDRFKGVNDTLGHDAGDLLLQQVADRILETARDIDIAARIGGDEFVVLQTSLGQASDAAKLARRLIDRLSDPYDINGQQVRVGATIGIAIYPRDGDSIDVLLKRADLALYHAKSKGRGDLCFFEPEMDTLHRERRALEAELAHAIRAGEMRLAFQPVFGTQSGDVVTLEALVRWVHPTRGVLPPIKFIQLAEETNLIIPLGEWVLETACQAAMTWQSTCRVAVNVSARQFSGSDLPAMVASVLDRTGLPASRLELEVTESLVITNTDHALQALEALKRFGVRIVLDDFGTGYSTLSYLQRFPFDKIKVDKSFIDGLASDKDARAIVNAILEMSHQLNVNVTAEGVETSAQLALLRSGRCDEIQGFLLGRPMRSEKVKDYLAGLCSVVEAEEPDAQRLDSTEPLAQEYALPRE
jgi:diguanylate cyclase (GGDEF)-like protein/PAS domain S-box-containing protein